MSLTIEALGVEHLRHLIYSERERLEKLDREIQRLQDLQSAQRSCAATLYEYEVLLAKYEQKQDETNWFYTTPRHSDELPMHTRVEVVNNNDCHHHARAGQKGTVIGYRYCPGAINTTGWHYLRLDGDMSKYPTQISQPYVHRDYLKVIE